MICQYCRVSHLTSCRLYGGMESLTIVELYSPSIQRPCVSLQRDCSKAIPTGRYRVKNLDSERTYVKKGERVPSWDPTYRHTIKPMVKETTTHSAIPNYNYIPLSPVLVTASSTLSPMQLQIYLPALNCSGRILR